MGNPGIPSAGMPPGEDYVVKQIAELKRQIGELGPSIAKSFASTVQTLEDTVSTLNTTVERLNGLTTVSATGSHINTGTVPGDSAFHWFDSSPALTLQTQCPTGKLLVTVGSGQCTLAPGDASAVGVISFVASSPSGWSVPLESADARLYFVNNSTIGLPLQVNAPLAGVPTTETITITVKFGIWSSSAATLASADFQSNYAIAQVLAN